MTDWTRLSMFANGSSSRVVGTVRYVASQPSWITRAALMVFLLVIGLPILLLLLIAIALAVIVFGSLALINALVTKVRGMLPGRTGRSNVRVIVRDDQ